MQHTRPPSRPLQRHSAAFTLMEVLIAMSIFTVGAIAVAAIFPVGVLLQRETINASVSAHVADGTTALLDARGFRFDMSSGGWDDTGTTPFIPGDGDAPYNTVGEVRTYPVPDENAGAPAGAAGTPDYGLRAWSLGDRGYPAIDGEPGARPFYWVPLVYDLQDSGGPKEGEDRKWMVFLFTLRREDNVDYGALGKSYPKILADGEGAADPAAQWAGIPGVAWIGANNAATTPYLIPGVTLTTAPPTGDRFEFNNLAPDGTLRVNVGDPILDQFGGVYRVIAAETAYIQVDRDIMPKPFTAEMPDGFWYAPGQAAKRIDVLVDSAANNLVYHQ